MMGARFRRPFLKSQFFSHAQGKVFGPTGRRNDAVGHRLAQFGLGCPGLLRDREVFGQSVRAIDGYGAGNPDQLPGFRVKDFFERVVKNFPPFFHPFLPIEKVARGLLHAA